MTLFDNIYTIVDFTLLVMKIYWRSLVTVRM